jgi:hypothetical protein
MPFTIQQQTALVDLLWSSMKRDQEHKDRVQTSWGTKTKQGLCSCIERIAEGRQPGAEEAPKRPYCKPLEAGLESGSRSVGRRVGRLLDAMSLHVNAWICSGEILNDLHTWRIKIISSMELDGWRIKALESDRMSVLPPKGEKSLT